MRAAIELVREAVRAGTVSSAHDVSDGGLGVRPGGVRASRAGWACASTSIGLVELRGASGEACLFGEGPGGFVVAGAAPPSCERWPPREVGAGVDVVAIGEAAGDRIEISAAEAEVSVELAAAERAWRSLRPGE